MSKKLRWIFAIISILGIAGTLVFLTVFRDKSSSFQLVKINFFSEPQCMEACWQGLRPGVTSKQELESYLDSSPFLNLSQRTGNMYGPNTTSYHASHKAGYTIQAFTQSNRLQEINLSGDLNLTLGTVIDVLGSTQYSYFYFSEAIGLEPSQGHLRLYYPEAGFIFEFNIEAHEKSGNDIDFCPQVQDYAIRISIVTQDNIKVDKLRDSLIQTGGVIDWPDFGCIRLTFIPAS